METAKKQDTNGDGLIDHTGTADQTYDVWTAKGVRWVTLVFGTVIYTTIKT